MEPSAADDPDALRARLQAEVEERARTLSHSPLADDDAVLDHAAAAAARGGEGLDEVTRALAELRTVPRAADGPGDPEPADRTAEILARLDATEKALEASLAVLRSPAHRHTPLEGQLDALRDRLRRADRAGAWPDAADDLLRRLLEIEERERTRRFEPWYPAGRFEDAFRGPTDDILRRYADLADRVAGAVADGADSDGTILDIGCGRGDLLHLLRERGVDARGVDTDADAVAAACGRGLVAETGDGLAALSAAEASSLAGVTAIQVLEHLTPQQVTEFVALAADRVRPGGIVVAETVNPLSLYVYTHAMWLDPTHTQPIHPAYLDFLFREAGFRESTVQWRSHTPESERLPRLDPGTADADRGLTEQLDVVIDRLNDVLFGPQDYAVLAVR